MFLRSCAKSLPLYLIIFCSALFLSITISPPAFHFNDEWISANQLYQLGAGHQVITNEGKYGTFVGNQITEYFSTRSNTLGYSLLLPILSLPIQKIFLSLDSLFRFSVILLWAILLVIIAICIYTFYPRYVKIGFIPWTWILIIIAGIGLLWNLAVFYPFSASYPYDPVEAAALIFTDHILFALLAVLFLFICRLLFSDSYYAFFGTLALVCSSSYLYWASSAKDHILVAVLFAAILASLILIHVKKNHQYGVLTFLLCGLLAWVRPELAFVTVLAVFCYFFGYLFSVKKTLVTRRKVITAIFIPCVLLVGSIPFFYNNYLISGDPLTPPYIFMTEERSDEIQTHSLVHSQNTVQQKEEKTFETPRLIRLITHYFQPKWDTVVTDIGIILFSPTSGMIGILAICPLFSIGVGLLLCHLVFHTLQGIGKYSHEILICTLLIGVVFIAYISDIHNMIVSEGIGPDMRYLSPIYIPGGILGLIAIRSISDFRENTYNLIKTIIPEILLLTPLIFIGIIVFSPFGGGFSGFTQFVTYSVLSLSFCFIIYQIIRNYLKIPSWINHVFLGLILSLPLSWNFILVIMFAVTRGNGYSFWLPVLERLYSIFIIPVG